MRERRCSYCGKKNHTSVSCYKRAWDKRLGRGKYKTSLNPSKSVSKAGLGSEMNKIPSRTKMTRSEASERRKLIKELDKYTSLVVRLGPANKSGKVQCYTCGKILPWNQVDNGHFWKRRRMMTRWDLDNLRPQCLTKGHKVGDKDISEIKIGDEIPSLFGKTRVVAIQRFWSPIIELKYEGGVIRSSPEHRLLVEYQNKLVWLSAQQIYDLLKNGASCNIIKVWKTELHIY